MAEREFDIVPQRAIAAGRATDAYFDRTVETLEHAGRNPTVVAEVSANQFPTGEWHLFAGAKDVANLLVDRDLEVHALNEGLLFDGGPVMRIRGPYLEFAQLETAILGFLSHASGIATNALRARRAAPDTPIVSFGTRHVHPSIAAMVERSALLADVDDISNVAAGKLVGRQAVGTMPHALLLCFGRGHQEAAWTAFDEAVDAEVSRVALTDTYADEVEEALRAANALGDALDSVRLDTTGSRRGDFEHIIREVRWALETRGRDDVGIFVSGGLGPPELRALRDHVDGFGVGGYIANADPVDFGMDIVSVDGQATAKRGRLPGPKQVYRTPDGDHHVGHVDRPGPTDGMPLLEPLVREGRIEREFDIEAAVERLYGELEKIDVDEA